MTVYGLMCVRNEADLVETTIRYHLALGIDRILVIDNGSTDGTDRILCRLARDLPVRWTYCGATFLQSDLTTLLAHEAYLEGADWVVPIDADEFWWTPGRPLREVLAASGSAVLAAAVVNFVQARDVREGGPRTLLTMIRRPVEPRGPIAEIERLVESRAIGFVEIEYPRKCVARASLAIRIGQGNHSVAFAAGEVESTGEIVCLHAPIRSRSQLDAKAELARPAEDVEDYLKLAWHVRRWRELALQGQLDEEWDANSYREDALDVGGVRRPLAFDTTLRDAVTPFVEIAMCASAAPADGGSAAAEPNLVLRRPIPDDFVDDVLASLETIEGWLSRREAAMLMAVTAAALLETPGAALIEVGSYCGKSTVAIGSAARRVSDTARVYAIDPHQGLVGAVDTPGGVVATPPTYDAFRSNLEATGLGSVVRPVVLHAHEVPWCEPIGMLFLDGLHDYESVRRDYQTFERFLEPRAWVVFDDYQRLFPGVVRFADERVAGRELEPVCRAGNLLVTRKTGPDAAEASGAPAAADTAP